jgi:hypothetical protein
MQRKSNLLNTYSMLAWPSLLRMSSLVPHVSLTVASTCRYMKCLTSSTVGEWSKDATCQVSCSSYSNWLDNAKDYKMYLQQQHRHQMEHYNLQWYNMYLVIPFICDNMYVLIPFIMVQHVSVDTIDNGII